MDPTLKGILGIGPCRAVIQLHAGVPVLADALQHGQAGPYPESRLQSGPTRLNDNSTGSADLWRRGQVQVQRLADGRQLCEPGRPFSTSQTQTMHR